VQCSWISVSVVAHPFDSNQSTASVASPPALDALVPANSRLFVEDQISWSSIPRVRDRGVGRRWKRTFQDAATEAPLA
jgi:hypothetical protein